MPAPGVQLYCGDCLSHLPGVPAASIALVLSDLPYGCTTASWDRPLALDRLWPELRRVLRPEGAVVLFGKDRFTAALVLSNPCWYRYRWVWEKSKATGWLNAKRRPMQAHEDLNVFAPRAPRYFPQMREGEPYDKGLAKAQSADDVYGKHARVVVKSETGARYPRDVLYFKTAEAERSEYPLLHKTQKPQALLRYLIATYTRPGEPVLDVTAGSFSTGVAALATGRSFIGMEADPEIFARGCRWLETVRGPAALLPAGEKGEYHGPGRSD